MEHSECVFCKIVAGQLPARIVHRDESVIAFMDINAASPGHVLVCPTTHYADMTEAPEPVLAALIARAKAVGMLQKERLGATAFNLVSANGRDAQQSVFHLHFHVIPRQPLDGLNLWFHGRKGSKGLEEAYWKLVE